MKSIPSVVSLVLLRRSWQPLALGLMLGGALEAAPAADGGAKTHSLFMGANVAIELDGKLCPVEDVHGSTFVVNQNGRRVDVPSTRTDLRIKMDRALKITGSAVTIANLKAERVYTPAADPRRRAMEAIDQAMGASAALDAAVSSLTTAQTQIGLAAASNVDAQGHPAPFVPAESTYAAHFDAIQSAGLAEHSIITSVPDAVMREGVELAREEFDAFLLTLDLSAPQALAKPYLVVETRYREQPERPETNRMWIYAESLPPIGPKPTKVRLRRGGFPPGYKLEDVQVHVYDQGSELATNVSPKRVPLTVDEAMLFLTIEHCAAHKNEDLPASVALAVLPGEIRRKVAQRGEPVWVKVSPEGRVTAVCSDEACAQPVVDPSLAEAVKEIRYKPALRHGKPVESVTRLRLADLPQKI